MVNIVDIVINEFELHSRLYVHFRTNNLEKVIKSLITLAVGYIVQLQFYHKVGFDIK